MKTKREIIEEIARKHLHLSTLDTRNYDTLDFSTQAVWQLRTALAKAFVAGRKHGLQTRKE